MEMAVDKQLTVDTYGKAGFAFSFPYDPALVSAIKQDLPGVQWDKPSKRWVTQGPEVMLDIRRAGYKLQYTPKALDRAREFRVFIDQLLDVRYQDIQQEDFAYQQVGIDVLQIARRAILADDPGLGKSRQAILAAQALGAKCILVVAMKTLTYNWEPEIPKWIAGASVSVVPDAQPARKRFWKEWSCEGWVIANYEKLKQAEWPQDVEWDVIIADEATYIKTASSARTKAFWKVARRCENVWLISGTPLEIRVEELYNLMSPLRPTVFGNYGRFRDTHLITDYFGSIVGIQNQTLLSERIAPWVIRRTKDDVALQLPDKLNNDVYVDLSVAEQATYRRLTAEFNAWLTEHGRDVAEANALTQLLRLQQYTSDPRLVDEDGPGAKINMLQELIGEWNGQAVVFTRFKALIPYLMAALGAHRDATIHGDIRADDRVARIVRFNDGELGKVLAMTDAAAHGLNITSADLIVHHDLLWNPAKMEQREGRLQRIGQTKTVNVVRLLAKGTVDEGMAGVLAERKELFVNIMAGAEAAAIGGLNLKKIAIGGR